MREMVMKITRELGEIQRKRRRRGQLSVIVGYMSTGRPAITPRPLVGMTWQASPDFACSLASLSGERDDISCEVISSHLAFAVVRCERLLMRGEQAC